MREARLDGGFVAPEEGVDAAGGWGDLAGDCAEVFGDEAVGGPVGEGDGSAGAGDAEEFGGSAFGAGGEHDAPHADDEIEFGVGIREVFGVPFGESDGEVFDLGAVAGFGDEVGGDVDAGGLATGAGGEEGEVASAAGDIEEARARSEREARHEFGGAGFVEFGDEREVAGFPGGFTTRAQTLLWRGVDVGGAHRSVSFEHETVDGLLGFAEGLEVFGGRRDAPSGLAGFGRGDLPPGLLCGKIQGGD